MLNIVKDMEFEVSEIKKLTEDSYAVRLSLDNREFTYLPGQFIMLKFDPLEETDDFKVLNGAPKIQSRAYSMSSSPLNKSYLEITSKKTTNGFVSDYMLKVLKSGHIVKVSGPYGKFVLDENSNIDIFLIGAGSGISPLMSILRYIIDKKININVTLLFSNKSVKDIIWHEELVELQEKFNNFKVFFTLTQNEDDNWKGFTGRVSADLVKNCVKDIYRQVYYICGPSAMVDATVKDLKLLNINDSNIKVEKYD
ncbi:MAG TPA: FAD-dependent oxidoreductase [Candidatus Nanoarchaeia archaeon]|nr:FAD-dependent oxidoreductase [Candidatus Nanoarchaeia archaeon]